jgi:hypothetical protein
MVALLRVPRPIIPPGEIHRYVLWSIHEKALYTVLPAPLIAALLTASFTSSGEGGWGYAMHANVKYISSTPSYGFENPTENFVGTGVCILLIYNNKKSNRNVKNK